MALPMPMFPLIVHFHFLLPLHSPHPYNFNEHAHTTYSKYTLSSGFFISRHRKPFSPTRNVIEFGYSIEYPCGHAVPVFSIVCTDEFWLAESFISCRETLIKAKGISSEPMNAPRLSCLFGIRIHVAYPAPGLFYSPVILVFERFVAFY